MLTLPTFAEMKYAVDSLLEIAELNKRANFLINSKTGAVLIHTYWIDTRNGRLSPYAAQDEILVCGSEEPIRQWIKDFWEMLEDDPDSSDLEEHLFDIGTDGTEHRDLYNVEI